MDTPAFLNWIADRLVYVYGESPNVDFVLRLRKEAAKAAEPRPRPLQATAQPPYHFDLYGGIW